MGRVLLLTLVLLGLYLGPVMAATPQCVLYDGTVPQCNPYVANQTIIAIPDTNAYPGIITALNGYLASAAALTPSCKAVITEFFCRSALQPCDIPSLPFPQRPCYSVCTNVIDYCWETLQIVGQGSSLPNCNTTDSTFGLPSYPNGPTDYSAFVAGAPIAPCQQPTASTPTAPLAPSFYCDPFTAPTVSPYKEATVKTYTYCPQYVGGIGAPIFATDQYPQWGIAAAKVEPALTQLVAALAIGLPTSCFNASVELLCKTAFNPCTRLPAGALGNPVALFAPSPPCRSLCDLGFSQCAQAFLLANNLQSLPDCNAASVIPGQVQYPTTGWSFTFNGLPVQLPCNPPANPTPPPTFYCQPFNATLTPTCAKYITYDVLIPPPFYSQAALSGYLAPNLKSTAALPSACKSYAEELICTSAFQPCSQTPITLPSPPSPTNKTITFFMGEPPCNAMCTAMQQQCAQVFSLVGQSSSIPDCESISSSTKQKTYPNTGLLFPFPFKPISVPCRPSQLGPGPAAFSCESFKGSPSACSPFVDYEFMVTPEFSQSYIAKAVAANLEGTEALPDAARIPLVEFICHTAFGKCDSQVVKNITFNWSRPPCNSACNKAVDQTRNIFVLAGNSDKLPDCEAVSTTNGQPSYPKSELTYEAFGTVMKVPCNPENKAKKYNKSPVRCTKYTGNAKFCKPYINEKSVFENDLLPFETSDTILQQLYDLYLEAPDDCRDYIHRIGCSVILAGCEEEKKDLPETMVFPRPPCSPVCRDVPDSCKKFWDQTGLPKPDCKEKDALTSQLRYPKDGWKFEYVPSKTKIGADCVNPDN
eukprot:TRINITY_DN301_c0_g1_i1.p1 TRINITY_DN301_c0_g1~~TRINITY_DN301_c0_g1_i1.p1  ORF type:complete len:816 (+),score=99.40 TRINITY_DN301_c0_g1_i1:182-2629(+)